MILKNVYIVMGMTDLRIAEHFNSIQGEGPYMGHPATFLRTQGCNLHCGFKDRLPQGAYGMTQEEIEDQQDPEANWTCDTISVWTKGQRYSPSELLRVFDSQGYTPLLRSGSHHLVYTGGEPLLQQNGFCEFYDVLEPHFVEVETNGTVIPGVDLLDRVDHFNVSPKLANSGNVGKRKNRTAINELITSGKAIFKFVVQNEEDLVDAERDFIQRYSIPENMVWLMPTGGNRRILEEFRPKVVELAQSRGYKFSDRMHIQIWDKKTGV